MQQHPIPPPPIVRELFEMSVWLRTRPSHSTNTGVFFSEEEPVDAQQRATLQEVHLQQIAGITDMIHQVKENLMQQQTLKHNVKQESSLEVFEKIGGGGFGEVFKGRFKGVSLKLLAAACLVSTLET